MNIYSVLDDSDNEEQQTKVATEKKAKDTAKPVAAKKDAAAAKPVKAVESKGKGDAPKPKSAPVGAAPKTAPVVESAAVDTTKDDNRGGRPRGKEYREKGGRGGRGGGESTEGERRPKRDFDRRSSAGRGRGEASKGGRGSFGAGNPAQDAQDAEKDPNSAEVVVESTEAVEEEPEVFVEPEPATFTLDQFMEKRNEARRALLANETKVRVVDQSALAGLSRKEDEGETTYMPVKASKADASRKDQRSTGKTQVLEVAFKFAAIQVDDDRGGRGGRGEGRGRGDGRGGRGDGRGRGAGRGEGRGGNKAPSAGSKAVFSNNDFPSL